MKKFWKYLEGLFYVLALVIGYFILIEGLCMIAVLAFTALILFLL